jgi:hypothetical protein
MSTSPSAARLVLASSLFFLLPARCGAGQPRRGVPGRGGAAGILERLSMEPTGEFVLAMQAFDALEQCNFCEWTCLLVPGARPCSGAPALSRCLNVCVSVVHAVRTQTPRATTPSTW